MSEETKAKLSKAFDTTKHQAWKYLGSMFMELKPGADGQQHQALSLTRVLTLVTFCGCFGMWLMAETEPMDSMLYTLWGLLGLKGADKFASSKKAS